MTAGLSLINSSSVPAVTDINWKNVLVAFVLYAITVVTIVGNVLVLIAVKINKKLHTIFNYYIVNLAITDVAVAVMAMSFMATHTVLGYWPFGEALCAIWIFFDYGMTFVSVFTLILISVDRFWSVKWSVHYRKYHTKRKCIISIICVWLFMVLLWVPPWVLDRVRYSEPGVCFWDPSLNKEFVFIVATLGHHGPYCIMIFCYAHVFVFMHKRRKIANVTTHETQSPAAQSGSIGIRNNLDNSNGLSSILAPRILKVQPVRAFSPPPYSYRSTEISNTLVTVSYLRVPDTAVITSSEVASASIDNQQSSVQGSRLSRDRKVFVTLTYIMIGYVVLWLPFHIVFDISILDPGLVPEQVLNMAFWMAYFNSTINPILYNFSSVEFRKSFRRILTRCKR